MYATLPPEGDAIFGIRTLDPGCKRKRSHHSAKPPKENLSYETFKPNPSTERVGINNEVVAKSIVPAPYVDEPSHPKSNSSKSIVESGSRACLFKFPSNLIMELIFNKGYKRSIKTSRNMNMVSNYEISCLLSLETEKKN
ncbi:hypothetical protein L484_016725 [Morus notabilis]|uniref:Uncharacterized protein n=1 Tax=Morus notabilis TaxID=981085 RepID=W9RQ68_9ROSA|nr:hypothetical protein L484_016725 [Morus notabilis]